MRPKLPAVLTAALVAVLVAPTTLNASMTSMRAPLFGAADEAMAAADAVDARVLAPISYAEAMSQYERADDTFKRAGSVDSIRRYLARAEAKFTKSSEAAGIAAEALEAMIRARADAITTDTASFARYVHDAGDPQSLGDDKVMSIFEDRRGVLWVGTAAAAVQRFDPAHWLFAHYGSDPGEDRGLSSNKVYAFAHSNLVHEFGIREPL